MQPEYPNESTLDLPAKLNPLDFNIRRDLFWLLFSWRGRIPRTAFWCLYIASMVLQHVLWAIFCELQYIAIINHLYLAWIQMAMQAKRLHDLNKSAWWMLVYMVPCIGPIIAIVELGFFRGTTGPNRFGNDYTQPRAGLSSKRIYAGLLSADDVVCEFAKVRQAFQPDRSGRSG